MATAYSIVQHFRIWFSIKLSGDYRTDGYLTVTAKSKLQAKKLAKLMLDPDGSRQLLILSIIPNVEY